LKPNKFLKTTRIEHACGHKEVHEILGKVTAYNHMVEFLQTKKCRECRDNTETSKPR